jgi:hypothetical protein
MRGSGRNRLNLVPRIVIMLTGRADVSLHLPEHGFSLADAELAAHDSRRRGDFSGCADCAGGAGRAADASSAGKSPGADAMN